MWFVFHGLLLFVFHAFFLIVNGYFDTLYLINIQITNLEVVPDTD